MEQRSITVIAEYDDEAEVWVASSDDICGLAVEAADLDTLKDRVMGALLDLIEMNGFDAQGHDISVHLTAEQSLKVSRAA